MLHYHIYWEVLCKDHLHHFCKPCYCSDHAMLGSFDFCIKMQSLWNERDLKWDVNLQHWHILQMIWESFRHSTSFTCGLGMISSFPGSNFGFKRCEFENYNVFIRKVNRIYWKRLDKSSLPHYIYHSPQDRSLQTNCFPLTTVGSSSSF